MDESSLLHRLRAYIDRMLNFPGMKVLIVDDETKAIISLVYTQTEILNKEVFLVETLGKKHQRMLHMKAVVFVRPTKPSVRALKEHLSDPTYGEYHVFFSNIVPEEQLEYLAQNDPKKVIKEVQEYYGDFFAPGPKTFHLNIRNSLSMSLPRSEWARPQKKCFQRSLQGLISVLLSLKVKPRCVFQKGSEISLKFAHSVKDALDAEPQLFTFGKKGSPNPVLLILDRCDDPISPLLMQWTYQAMVHELLGIENNCVNMTKKKRKAKDLDHIILQPESDEFYKNNMYANFGDVGLAIKKFVELYQAKSKNNTKVETIEDMQRFLENYPEVKAMGMNVAKHVQLFGELSRMVDENNCMDISMLEQDLACSESHSKHCSEVRKMIQDSSTNKVDALRLVLLYAVRYETTHANCIHEFKRLLTDRGLKRSQIMLVDLILRYCGAARRNGDLFGDQSTFGKFTTSLVRGLKGVANVYTQHKPLLVDTCTALLSGRISEKHFGVLGSSGTSSVATLGKPSPLIVFVLGGMTYEEAAAAAKLEKDTRTKIYVGGTYIHSSDSFLRELQELDED